MDGKYLLDASIVIPLLNGDADVLLHLESDSEVFVPTVALGELFFGAAKSAWASENIDRAQEFAAGGAIVPCDLNVAREYGRVKSLLKAEGRPIPENDIWIAAAAICHGLTLVTRDIHFREVEGLRIADWSTETVPSGN